MQIKPHKNSRTYLEIKTSFTWTWCIIPSFERKAHHYTMYPGKGNVYTITMQWLFIERLKLEMLLFWRTE